MFKVGDKVKMRNGQEARILCTDLKQKDKPIAAALFFGESEVIRLFTVDGYHYSSDDKCEFDLIIEPEYEWQWLIKDGLCFATEFFKTEESMNKHYGLNKKTLYRIEESKREVKNG